MLQELNLFYHYPSIFWNTAVLEVESGSVEQETEVEDKQTKEKGTNYGAMATAISNLQQHGVKVVPPHINQAQVGFKADVEKNEILFGLKGISRINLEVAKVIIDHRPYASLQDFCERLVWTKREVQTTGGKVQQKAYLTNAQVVALIKAGAFDELEGKPRETIMSEFLKTFFEGKKQLNQTLLMEMAEQNLLPPDLETEIKCFNFREFVRQLPKEADLKAKSLQWATFHTNNPDLDAYAETFFQTHLMDELEEGRDYRYHEAGHLQVAIGTTRKGSFEAVMKTKLIPLQQWFTSDQGLVKYNEYLFNLHQQKHAKGTISSWEMEVMGFYYHEHEVSVISKEIHQLSDYQTLPETPTIVGYNTYKNIQYPKYQLSRIIGCVLDRNTTKHTVSLLTESGVVKVKFHAGAFAHYDKAITTFTPTGEKVLVEESWFKKGTLLIITGYRLDTMFRPKVYKDTPFKHTVERILEIQDNGNQVAIQQERTQV